MKKEKDKVMLSEVNIGDRFTSRATGQLLEVTAARIGELGRGLKVRALTEARGAGSSRAAPLGEERYVTNGHQWCNLVQRALVQKAAAS